MQRSQRLLILSLSILVGLISGCRYSRLPLAASVPMPGDYPEIAFDDQSLLYLMITDSLALIARFIPDNDTSGSIELRRAPLNGTGMEDTVVFQSLPILKPISKRNLPNGINLKVNWNMSLSFRYYSPRSGYILFPLPLGDTSNMKRIGNLEGVYSDTFTRKKYENSLRSDGQLFYIVDAHANQPRTVAAFEGLVFNIHSPYMLLYTGATHKSGTIAHPDNMDFSTARYDIVDLRDLTVTLDFPDRKGGGGLTPDGRFLYLHGDPLPDPVQDSIIFMTDLWNATEFNLDSGSSRDLVLRIPYNALGSPRTHGFLSENGKAFFVGSRNSWGMEFDRSFNLPPVADFEDSVYSAIWFADIIGKDEWLTWKLSPQGNWLVVNIHHKGTGHGFIKYSLLLPSKVLTIPEVFDSLKLKPIPFKQLNRLLYQAYFEFVPGEKWVLIKQEGKFLFSSLPLFLGIGSSPRLYRCNGSRRPVRLAASNEHIDYYDNVFFSPDGQYVGYVCKISGRQGYWLQVRKLPE